jgi:hypothetical protein
MIIISMNIRPAMLKIQMSSNEYIASSNIILLILIKGNSTNLFYYHHFPTLHYKRIIITILYVPYYCKQTQPIDYVRSDSAIMRPGVSFVGMCVCVCVSVAHLRAPPLLRSHQVPPHFISVIY